MNLVDTIASTPGEAEAIGGWHVVDGRKVVSGTKATIDEATTVGRLNMRFMNADLAVDQILRSAKRRAAGKRQTAKSWSRGQLNDRKQRAHNA